MFMSFQPLVFLGAGIFFDDFTTHYLLPMLLLLSFQEIGTFCLRARRILIFPNPARYPEMMAPAWPSTTFLTTTPNCSSTSLRTRIPLHCRVWTELILIGRLVHYWISRLRASWLGTSRTTSALPATTCRLSSASRRSPRATHDLTSPIGSPTTLLFPTTANAYLTNVAHFPTTLTKPTKTPNSYSRLPLAPPSSQPPPLLPRPPSNGPTGCFRPFAGPFFPDHI